MKSSQFVLVASMVISFLSITTNSTAQAIEIEREKTISILSEVLNEERIVSIYLPNSYDFTDHNFPVLYLLDGRTHFQHAKGAVDFLSSLDIIPQTIVVAIHNIDRNRDFSPIHDDRVPTSGGGEKFLKFLDQELIRYMSENYRISDFSTLMGHSFGGTFTTYALLTQPELFDGYLMVSPYLHFMDNHLIKEAESKLRKKYDGQKIVYITVGDEPNYFDALGKFTILLEKKAQSSITFNYQIMDAENHATIPYSSVFNGLRFIYSDWPLEQKTFQQGLTAIDEHYKTLAKKYGLELGAPENVINNLGYYYLQNSNVEQAIVVFKENVKRNPLSPNVYDSLGEAYENNGQLKLALKNYQKAFDLGTEQMNGNTVIFKKNLTRLKQKP